MFCISFWACSKFKMSLWSSATHGKKGRTSTNLRVILAPILWTLFTYSSALTGSVCVCLWGGMSVACSESFVAIATHQASFKQTCSPKRKWIILFDPPPLLPSSSSLCSCSHHFKTSLGCFLFILFYFSYEKSSSLETSSSGLRWIYDVLSTCGERERE